MIRSEIIDPTVLVKMFEGSKGDLSKWGIPGFETLRVEESYNTKTFVMSKECTETTDYLSLAFICPNGNVGSSIVVRIPLRGGDLFSITYTIKIYHGGNTPLKQGDKTVYVSLFATVG